ncbi:MAG TPA: M23 family metallopeptidase [Bacteroidales bacterium]|nr:M23 family metallopeptidase [Bacteroidales bacterium]
MKKGKKRDWGHSPKLLRKYKLVLMDAQTYEEKFSFLVTRLGVFVSVGTLIVVLIVLTIYLVAFTSLREYIPGYTNLELPQQIYELQQKADSLETEFKRRELFLENLHRIINDEILPEDSVPIPEAIPFYDTITLRHSSADSLLREEFENQTQFNLYPNTIFNYNPANIANIYFFTPINGIITRKFDPNQRHFGIDIVANENESIKSILDGTVIFSDWTLETGYIVCIQHQHQLISVYKHNSSLLKQQGTRVKAGEIISFVGASGELQTGPHLHFELWYEGNPVDPEQFISF